MQNLAQQSRPNRLSDAENIPAELKALPNWILVTDTKEPRWCNAPQYRAATDDVRARGTFKDAYAALCRNQYILNTDKKTYSAIVGLGFVLTPEAGIAVADFDNIGKLEPQYRDHASVFHVKFIEHAARAGAYVERSQSGTGVHVVMRGALPRGAGRCTVARNMLAIELYAHGQYIWFTGDLLTPWQSGSALPEGSSLFGDVAAAFERTYGIDASTLPVDIGDTADNGRRLDLTDNDVLAALYARGRLAIGWYEGSSSLCGRREDWSGATLSLIGELDKITGSADQVRRLLLGSPRLRHAGANRRGEDRYSLTERMFYTLLAKARQSNTTPEQLKRYAMIEHGRQQAKNLGMV